MTPTTERPLTADPLATRVARSIRAVFGGQSVKARVLRGGVGLGSGSVAEQVARFARNMILARLLAPDAFGIMAIALSAASLVDAILDVGVRESIIQNPRGAERRYLNVAWWLAMARGTIFYSVIFLAAPWIARFYGTPLLLPVLRVALLSVVFHSAMSSGANLAIKEMRFFKWALINHGGAIFGVGLTLILGFTLKSVWALAIGYCAENAFRCVLSYVLCPFIPSLRLDREAGRDLLKFSRGIFGLAFLNLIFLRTDIFVLAKLYPATTLGLYALAVYLIQTPTSFIMNLLGQTMLPTFSHFQGQTDRINRILEKVIGFIVILGLPGIVVLYFCGRSILTVVYGSQYSSAAIPLLIAAVVGVINLSNGQITTVFLASGHPHVHRTCVAIMAATMVVLVYPLAKGFGPAGGQLACLISMTLGFLYQVRRICGITHLKLRAFQRSLILSISVSLSVFVVCLITQGFSFSSRPVPNITFVVTISLCSYVVAYFTLIRDGQRNLLNKNSTSEPLT